MNGYDLQGKRRILVCGLTGAGKTTVGKKIAESLSLPLVELDGLLWLPEYRQRTDEDFRAQIRVTLGRYPEGWVAAGNLIRPSDGMVFREADAIVWLRMPFPLTFWRLLRRTTMRILTGYRYPVSGDRTLIRREFFSRRSLILYAVRNRKPHVETVSAMLAALTQQPQVIVVRSKAEVAQLLASLPSAGRLAAP